MDRSLLSASLSLFFGKVGSVLLSALITPVLVRLLGSGPYGDYAFVISTLAIATIVVNFGITDGIRKFIAEDRRSESWKESVFVFYGKVAVLSLFVAVSFVLLLDAVGVIERTIGSRLSGYVTLFCLLLVADQFETVGRNTLMGLGLEHVSEPLTIVRRALFGLCAIGFVLLGWGTAGALLGQVVGFGAVAAVMVFYIDRELNWRDALRTHSRIVPSGQFLSYNMLTVVLVLLSTTLYNVDVVLLRIIRGDDAAGYYNGALVIAEFLWLVPMVLQTVLVHSTSELWSRGDGSEVSTIASLAIRYTILLSVLPLIGLAILADAFVPLYFGAEFGSAVDPLRILLPGVFGLAIARILIGIGQGKGQLRVLIVATGTAAVLNLVLNLVLIPRYGMSGAAFATSVGYGSMALFHSAAAFHIGFNPFRETRALRIGVTALLSYTVLLGVDLSLHNQYARLTIVPAVGLSVYVALSVLTGAIDRQEQRRVSRAIRNGARTLSRKRN